MLFITSNMLSVLILAIYIYTLISTVVVIIMQNRNPIRSIAWIVALIFLPFVGLFFYLLFGQNIRQKNTINKLSLRQKAKEKSAALLDITAILQTAPSEAVKGLIKLLYTNSDAYPYSNSAIAFYTNGKETFRAIFESIAQAKDHIHIEFYIIANDALGLRLQELLIQKAQQGVQVRVIYDYWGSFKLSSRFLKPLKEAGVKAHAFFPPKFPFVLSRINYRNHRKIIVIDGNIGYTGGLNVAKRYFNGDNLGPWRDTMIRLEGPAVSGLQEIFINDWFFVDRIHLKGKQYFPSYTSNNFPKNCVQLVNAGPNTRWMSIMHGIFYAISRANNYVYIQTPYFMPPELILHAIQTAALRGVEVRLMLPKLSRLSIVRSSNSSYIEFLLDAGVQVFFYEKGFLHSKTIVVDDSISIVGTSNLDFRSFEQNFEVNAFIYDKDSALKLKAIFLEDMHYTKQVNEKKWRKRPRGQRIMESFSRLFSPMM